MRLKSFGTVTLPELNGNDGGLGSQARSNLIGLRDGGYDLDGNEIYLQPMNISRSAVLIDDIDATIDSLFGEMRKGRMLLKAQMRDNSERHSFAKMSGQMRQVSADKYNCEQPISLQWSANYPYWLDTLEDFQYFDHGLNFDDSLAFDDVNESVTQVDDFLTTSTVNVTNNSKFKIYRLFFCFQGVAPFSCSNIRIVNNTNSSEILWNGTLNTVDVGKRLDIDCLAKKAFSSNSSNEYASIQTLGSSTIDWFCLETGVNNITYSVTNAVGSGNLDIHLIWATHYL